MGLNDILNLIELVQLNYIQIEMFLQAQFKVQDHLRPWEPKVVVNNVLKMPPSLSPFLQPLQCSPHQEDTFDYNILEDLSRLNTNHFSPFSPSAEPAKTLPPFLSSSQTFQRLAKQNKCSFQSKGITLLNILRLVKSEGGLKRSYLVEFRYGSLAKKHYAKMSESRILRQDPELLIEFLVAARKR